MADCADGLMNGNAYPMGNYQHFAVWSRYWRYTLANDGIEELYDHRSDPSEWTNLWD